jgi:long-chain acyl-CoA synthetase
MNLMRDFANWVERRPEAPTLIHEDRVYSYGELMQLIDKCGLALKKLEVGPGDRVALMMNNRPEFVVAYQATVKIGAIIVPINTFLKEAELLHQVNDVGAKVFIGNDWAAAPVNGIKDKLETVKQIILTGVEGYPDFQDFIGSERGVLEMYDAHDDDVAVIKYTAGTTGRPKGVMQTHGSIYGFMRDTMNIRSIEPEHCILLFVPMFHGFGDHCCMNPVLMCGASFVIMDPFHPDEIFQAIQSYKCRYFGCTPSMLYGLMHSADAEKYDLSSLDQVLTGGGPVTPDIAEGFERKFGIKVLQGYGLSEGTAGYTYTRLDMPFKEGSCGIPLPGVELKIVDEQGAEVPVGQPGEIVARSSYNMKGYWNNPGETEKTIRNKWLHTGDVGRLDEEGYLYVIDRKKDIIIMSGENIYPVEIEDILLQHPAVAQAVVIGAPEPRRGEVPCAVVVLHPGASLTEHELIEFCKPKMASFKVPRMVKFRDSMPLSAQFKVLKRELRSEYFGS